MLQENKRKSLPDASQFAMELISSSFLGKLLLVIELRKFGFVESLLSKDWAGCLKSISYESLKIAKEY